MGTLFRELQPGAGNQVNHDARDDNLTGVRQRGDPSARVHGDPADPPVNDFDFAGVPTGSGLEPKHLHGLANTLSTLYGASGAIKGGEKTVASRVDLLPSEPRQLLADRSVMLNEQITPFRIA